MEDQPTNQPARPPNSTLARIGAIVDGEIHVFPDSPIVTVTWTASPTKITLSIDHDVDIHLETPRAGTYTAVVYMAWPSDAPLVAIPIPVTPQPGDTLTLEEPGNRPHATITVRGDSS